MSAAHTEIFRAERHGVDAAALRAAFDGAVAKLRERMHAEAKRAAGGGGAAGEIIVCSNGLPSDLAVQLTSGTAIESAISLCTQLVLFPPRSSSVHPSS